MSRISERRLRNRCKKKVRSRSDPKLGPSWLVAACAIAEWERLTCPVTSSQGHVATADFSAFFFQIFWLTPHLRFWQKSFGSRFCLGARHSETFTMKWSDTSSPSSRLREGYGGPREIREGQNN